MEGQTDRQGDGSHFRKPEGLEGADRLPPLKRLPPPDREEEAERFPNDRPARGGPEEEGSTSGEEEEVRDLALPKERETARLEEIIEDR